MSLSGGCAVVLGGLGGLAWWGLRQRRRPSGVPDASQGRFRPAGLAAIVVLLAIVGVGVGWRSDVAARGVAQCAESPGVAARHLNAELLMEKVVTWPETGVAMLYAHAIGSSLCRYPPADYYVDFHSGRLLGTRTMNVGDAVLAPPFDTAVHRGEAVADHEANHRPQWAVATVVGGPFAFPIIYGIDDFFFPGDRNHFERLAGLESGRYRHTGYAPVLGWPQIGVLIAVGALVALVVYRRLRRRHRARPAARPHSTAVR